MLYSVAELVKNYCVIYLVDTSEVPDFNTMYELYDPCTVMFFYRNKVRRLPALAGTACEPMFVRPLLLHPASRCRLLSTS